MQIYPAIAVSTIRITPFSINNLLAPFLEGGENVPLYLINSLKKFPENRNWKLKFWLPPHFTPNPQRDVIIIYDLEEYEIISHPPTEYVISDFDFLKMEGSGEGIFTGYLTHYSEDGSINAQFKLVGRTKHTPEAISYSLIPELN